MIDYKSKVRGYLSPRLPARCVTIHRTGRWWFYKQNRHYMNIDKAEKQIRGYLRQYNLDDEWEFRWTKSVLNFGHAMRGVRRGVPYNEISLSRPLTEVRSEHDVRMTMLHEVAHALVGLEHNHDAVWKARCLEIGGNGRAKEDSLDDNAKVANYSYLCGVDGRVINVSQKRLSVLGWQCRHHPQAEVLRYVRRGGVSLLDQDTINLV